MRVFNFAVLTLMLGIGGISTSHADVLMCPTQISIEHIKELKSKDKDNDNEEGIELPTAVHTDDGTVKPITMKFTAGKGVDEIHTKLPISSKKFEASKVLNEAKQVGDDLICTYQYDKTFGRTATFDLHTKKP